MAKLSIVVPVYNVQDYIDECVRSIIDQKENDIEIVLVDDGSTDQSGKICDSWAERTSKIKVVHKENLMFVYSRRFGKDWVWQRLKVWPVGYHLSSPIIEAREAL